MDETTLEIAGDGPDRKVLEELAGELKISDRVKFVGYQSPEQVRELLKGTDVFVLTSFAEGLPVVLMEAMAAGVPVVASSIAGIPELVQDEHNGLLVPPGDARATAGPFVDCLTTQTSQSSCDCWARERSNEEFDSHAESRWLAAIMIGELSGDREKYRYVAAG